MSSRPYRETLLYRQLHKIKDQFDYCFIDCCPTLGDLTVNAILAADKIIVPITYENDALEGMYDLFAVTREIKENRAHSYHILRNQKDVRKSKTNEYIEAKLSEMMIYDQILKTIIRQDENINQAKIEGLPIFLYAPHSNGAKDFNALAEEIICLN
jgi:chromosome partitioning protein